MSNGSKQEINFTGISTFALCAIPAVLALAAIWWLTFGEGLHYFSREMSQEHRHAEIVGAKNLPKAPLKISLIQNASSPIVIEQASIDGDDVWVYYRNVTTGSQNDIEYSWKQISPDGTVIQSVNNYYPSIGSENNAPDSLGPNERGEMHLKIKPDPRTVTLVLKMSVDKY